MGQVRCVTQQQIISRFCIIQHPHKHSSERDAVSSKLWPPVAVRTVHSSSHSTPNLPAATAIPRQLHTLWTVLQVESHCPAAALPTTKAADQSAAAAAQASLSQGVGGLQGQTGAAAVRGGLGTNGWRCDAAGCLGQSAAGVSAVSKDTRNSTVGRVLLAWQQLTLQLRDQPAGSRHPVTLTTVFSLKGVTCTVESL